MENKLKEKLIQRAKEKFLNSDQNEVFVVERGIVVRAKQYNDKQQTRQISVYKLEDFMEF